MNFSVLLLALNSRLLKFARVAKWKKSKDIKDMQQMSRLRKQEAANSISFYSSKQASEVVVLLFLMIH